MTIKRIIQYIHYNLLVKFDKLVKKQRINPETIPVIIINFNQLEHLQTLINFLNSRNIKNIVVIDNNSDYKPLLEYYETIKSEVSIERMESNFGHMVFFNNLDLLKKYGQGYYILTDADILPNPNLPTDFLYQMLRTLDKYAFKRSKVGFALDIDSIPDFYPHKNKVIDWESKFWKTELERDIYTAHIDTTFALYKPNFPKPFKFDIYQFYRSIRMGGKFTALHMGWYINPKNLTEEQRHYFSTSSNSNSWKIDEDGNLSTESDY